MKPFKNVEEFRQWLEGIEVEHLRRGLTNVSLELMKQKKRDEK
jgi:hypothetical protein